MYGQDEGYDHLVYDNPAHVTHINATSPSKNTAQRPPEVDTEDEVEREEHDRIMHESAQRMKSRHSAKKVVDEKTRMGRLISKIKRISNAMISDVDILQDISASTKVPQICMVGAHMLEPALAQKWYSFCKSTVHSKLYYADTSAYGECPCVFAFNTHGECIHCTMSHLEMFGNADALCGIECMCLMDSSKRRVSLYDLEKEESCLVYDPLDPRSREIMMDWRCDGFHSVIQIDATPLQNACVARRVGEQIIVDYNVAL